MKTWAIRFGARSAGLPSQPNLNEMAQLAGSLSEPWPALVGWVLVGAASLCAAYASPPLSGLVLVYLFALVQLARASSWRQAAYTGFALGLLAAVAELGFFYRIFSFGALALWGVWAFWIGLYVALARLCLRRLGAGLGWLLLPFLWVGLEFFRSELYYLRFSWVNTGYAFAAAPGLIPLHDQGVYGAGFLFMCLASGAAFLWTRSRLSSTVTLTAATAAIALVSLLPGSATERPSRAPANPLHIAGIQMEFPSETEVLFRLNDLLRRHPGTELVVLSEYTFAESVPAKLREWCRKNRRYVVVGGKDSAPNGDFYNTAFVIGPTGETVFRQVKAVPIQFFKDGQPAPEQRLWASPWGRIGICICYDLSYRRVTDQLVRQGAQALIVPTMDVADWGARQHELHSRVAPVRAAEYGIPIFRLASSGISQLVDATGRVKASAPYPGEAAVLRGVLELRQAGRLPIDRWLAPGALAVVVLLLPLLARFGGGRQTSGSQNSALRHHLLPRSLA